MVALTVTVLVATAMTLLVWVLMLGVATRPVALLWLQLINQLRL